MAARLIISQSALVARHRSVPAWPLATSAWLATVAQVRMGSIRSAAVWNSAYSIDSDRLGNCIPWRHGRGFAHRQ